MPNTVHLHRVLAAKPDKVYRAFLEADALVLLYHKFPRRIFAISA
jgi:uncharacterized protein YndB with AHSA1/START domain